MRYKSTRVICDSDNPDTPLFAVYDSLTDTWYELDADLWADVALQADDPVEEFASLCPGCIRPPLYCSCPLDVNAALKKRGIDTSWMDEV